MQLNLKQAAKFVGLSRTAVYKRMRAGKFPSPSMEIDMGDLTLRFWETERLRPLKREVLRRKKDVNRRQEIEIEEEEESGKISQI